MDDLKNLFIGGTSSIISRTATSPLEIFRLQRQNPFMPNSTIINVMKVEGLKGLWKGNGTNCIRVFPQYAISYSIYQRTNKFLKNNDNHNFKNFISGVTAGVISLSIIFPLETARTHLSLQSNKNSYNGILDVLKKVKFKAYNGLQLSIIGFPLWNGLNMSSYFYYKKYFKSYELNENVCKLLCGGLAGMTAISVTYPTDLVKRRLQLQTFDNINVPKYNGVLHCFRKIIRNEGVRGLYRGLYANYMKTFPAIAVQFWALELLHDFI